MEVQGQHRLSKCVVTDNHFVIMNNQGEVSWLSQITGHSIHHYQHLKSFSLSCFIPSLPIHSLSSFEDTLLIGDAHGFVTLFSSLSNKHSFTYHSLDAKYSSASFSTRGIFASIRIPIT